MKKLLSLFLFVISLGLWSGTNAEAQPYSNAVMALNPVGYWPLTETVTPPFGYYIATNLGTAGANANGYYQTWYQPLGNAFYPSNNIVHGPGATGDGDTALQCGGNPLGIGQYVVFPRATNGVANPAVAIQGPFTVELWVKSGNTNLGVQPIVNEGRNPVSLDPNVGYTNTYVGFSLGQFKNFFYFQVYDARANGNANVPESDTAPILANTWYHIVGVFDGVGISIFANGVQVGATKTVGLNYLNQHYTVDPVSPLLIGTGTEIPSLNGGVGYLGSIDEVAIYNGTLSSSQISTHFAAGAGTGYSTAVQTDSPLIYLRLNEPALNTYPSTSTYPVATNYGLMHAAANGAYQPGTAPGAAGPAYSGFGANSRSVAFNSFYGGVDVGGGALPGEFNPTNHLPFSVVTWFQGNPADAPARFQVLMGHSDASWRLTLDGGTATSVGGNRFNPGNGPELSFANTADLVTNGFHLNDGQWHMVAGVSDGANDFLYLDGVLAKSGTAVGAIAGSAKDLMLGGDPQYTVPSAASAGILRGFDGQLAHAAFFTNALTALQIQQLYGAAAVPPSIYALLPASVTNNSGSTVSIPVLARGSAPLGYQWYRTNGTLAAGQTTSALTFNPAVTNNSGAYFVVVSNSAGMATSSVVALTVLGPPIIQQQTATDLRVFVGTTPTLRVSASGPPPLVYQWKQNGLPISGATSSAYVVTNTASVATLTYDCTITNFAGSAALSTITVSVLADPASPYPLQVLNDKPVAYYRLDEGPDDGNGNQGVRGYDYAGGFNGNYSNVNLSFTPNYDPATDSDPAAQFGFFLSHDSFLGNVSSLLNFAAPTNNSVQVSVEAWVNAPFSQSLDAGIVTLGYGFGGEQFNLDVGGRNGSSHTFRFYVVDANNVTHAATSSDSGVAQDGLWHHLVGVCDEVNGKVSLYIDGALKASGTINPGSGLRSLTSPLSIGSRLSTAAATNYDTQFIGNIDEVAIYNVALSSNQVQSHYFSAGIAPLITALQSPTVETNQGATAVFRVTAVGTPPLSYQWTDNNGAPIGFGTNATLTLTNVQQSQQGQYSVTVTDLYGSASTNGTLIVDLGPPAIQTDLQPLNQTVYAGVSLTYSVTASGSVPFAYQWFRNGSTVAGATNSSYTFPALVGTNTYFVSVTNAFSQSQVGGPTFSSTATVIGVPAPTLNPGDYNYKMKITFAGYNRGETLADFPALIKLGTNTPGFSYGQLASPSGGDLRFTDAGGTREIPHEVDEWNPGGVSILWVQVPALATTNDFIWAYWGNPADANPPAYSTNGSVWIPQPFENQPSYEVVYHLKEGALPFADSTLQHPAIAGAAPAATNGIIGVGGAFSSSYLDAGTFDLGDAFTLSVWANINTGISDIQTLWANQTGGFGHNGFAMTVDSFQTSDQQLRISSGDGTAGNETGTAGGAVSFGLWHFLTESVNRTNGTVEFYVDGVRLSTSSTVVRDFATTNDVNLGQFVNGSFPMHGLMDEARIRSGNSSSNWVWASYMTAAQNTPFQTYSAISSSIVTLTIVTVGNNVVLTWPQGTLQAAPQVNGTYTNVPSATSPYTNAISGSQQYFRVKVR